MSEAGSESDDSVARPGVLSYVWTGGETNFDYEPGLLEVGEQQARKRVAVILITASDSKVVAALPHRAWDKKVSKRKFPAGPFTRPSLVEVVASESGDRAQTAAFSQKVWLGLLSKPVADAVVFGEPWTACEVTFSGPDGQPSLPYAPALVQVADVQFSFVTAAEVDPSEARLRALEEMMSQVTASLKVLTETGVGGAAAGPAQAAKPKTRAKKEGSVPGTPKLPGRPPDLPGLDPGLEQAAVDAGVSREALSEFRLLLGRRGGHLPDFPAKPDVLGEPPLGAGVGSSAEEEDDALELVQESPDKPVEAAVVALTKIVARLAKSKSKSEAGSKLEAALDRAEGGASSTEFGGSASSGGRSKGAALRVLKEALTREPEAIYTSVERLLEEDLLHRRIGTSLEGSRATARAWLEHRSHVGNYPTTVRLLWGICGIWDALRSGNSAEARARCALLVAAGDQQSLDHGSWILADQVCLEPVAPIGVFAGRRAAQTEVLDSFHTRLLEPRWCELFLHRVRELELHLESKRKLGKGRAGAPDAPTGSEADGRGDRPKGGKGRDKAGPSGGQEK